MGEYTPTQSMENYKPQENQNYETQKFYLCYSLFNTGWLFFINSFVDQTGNSVHFTLMSVATTHNNVHVFPQFSQTDTSKYQ